MLTGGADIHGEIKSWVGAEAWNRQLPTLIWGEGLKSGCAEHREAPLSGDRTPRDHHPTASPPWEVGGKAIGSEGWGVEG